ncbi:E3 ubiquitin-protein ligase UPL4 [Spatholobus suberectus]|nr:E3 ubiquitin-protein ligase UPL4 [Spatholobus suberectus]
MVGHNHILKLMYPVFSGIQLSLDCSQKPASRDALKCLCYAFSTGQSPTSSEVRNCKLNKDSVYNPAEHIKTKYFALELFDSEKGLTDILQNLRALSNDLLNMSTDNHALAVHERRSIIYCIKLWTNLLARNKFLLLNLLKVES